MTLILRYAAKSDVGMVRSSNEDSGFAGNTLLAVADGMGGHAAGELASSAAIATLAELDGETLATGDVLTALDDSVVAAAERIAGFVAMDPARSGMGTTVTAIAWRDGRIAVIHVGDSRAYLLRDGELTQITKDHTYVQSLVEAGQITAAEARVHPRRSLLLRAIDGNQVPERDISVREAHVADRYLLCSDGLSGVLTDDEIALILASSPDPTATVTNLVDRALDGGAPDNVTVVVADVVDVPDSEALSRLGQPVVVGAAGEQRNRAQLPGLHFPDDVGVDPETTDPGGIPVQPDVDWVPPESDDDTEVPTPVGEGAATVVASDTQSAGEHQQPKPSLLRRYWSWLAVAGLAVGVLVLGVLGLGWWLSSQWYVGNNAGYVAIYRGVPETLLSLPLNQAQSTSALQVSVLPYYDQQRVAKTIDAATLAEAQRIVANLAEQADKCAATPRPVGCPLPPSPASPTSPDSAAPTATITASPLDQLMQGLQ